MPPDIALAQHALRGLRKDVSEEGESFVIQQREQRYLLPKSELDEYLGRRPELQRATETQLFFPGFYEHVVRFEGTGPRRIPRRGEDGYVLTSADGLTRIELGRLSSLFCLSLTDVERMNSELRRFALMGVNYGRPTDDRPLGDLFRLSSIRVTAPADSGVGKNPRRLHELAEAAAFHIAFGQGVSISFTKSWDRTYYWLGRKEAQDVQFPLRTYNTELIAYYNLALASDSLILGYLALYKILEFFYTSVSEDALHQKVREHLVAPDFAHTKTKKVTRPRQDNTAI